jgi:3-oxoacyl-(acyl-carrier-protein) synthase
MEGLGALTSLHNDSPEDACKPFDIARSGTVLSDGGAMIMLENEQHALKRGVKKIYGEVVGFGQTNDAY